MSTKQDALVEVVDLMKRHGLTISDVSSAFVEPQAFTAAKSGGVLSKIFSYLGGIFVLAGLCIYVGMRWDDLGPAGRVLITLGPGFCVFVLALVCTADARLERAATPLFLAAALLQPTGIVVMLTEYSRGGEPAHGLLFMNLVMAIQQGCTFWARRRTVLAFTTIVFGLGFFTIAFDLLGVHHDVIGLVMGTSLLCIAWSLDRSTHRAIAGLAYFFGAVILLAAAYDTLKNTAVEMLFVGLASGIVVLATVTRSRSLLVVGTLALIGYIGNFIAEHFANTLAAPLILMLVGAVFIGCGAVAVRINRRYISKRP